MSSGWVERRGELARRLFSLSGVVPLGVFVVVYLWKSASAMRGREAFDASWAAWAAQPFSVLVVWLGFWIPLAFHALYGLRVSSRSRINLRSYAYSRNLMYVLQRITALLALGFVSFHAWRFHSGVSFSDGDFYGKLCADLSSTHFGLPLVAASYLLGLAAVVFHLTNGLYTFCRTWGVVADRRAGLRLSAGFGLFGIVLYGVASATVIYFATGTKIVLAPGRPAAGIHEAGRARSDSPLASAVAGDEEEAR